MVAKAFFLMFQKQVFGPLKYSERVGVPENVKSTFLNISLNFLL